MSLDYERGILKYSQSKGSARLVLMILAFHANENGECWPYIGTIAEEMNGSRTAVNRAISQLKQMGEISVIKRGHARSAIFKILLPPINKRPDFGTLDENKHPESDMLPEKKYAESDTLDKNKRAEIGMLDGPNVPISVNKRAEIGTHELPRTTNTNELPAANDGGNENLPFDPIPIDPELAACTNLYRNNIGELGQLQLQDFKDIFSGLSPPPAETKQSWYKYAILQANDNSVNKWAYVKAILERINNTGSLMAHKEEYNGSAAIENRKRKTYGPEREGKASKGTGTKATGTRRGPTGAGTNTDKSAADSYIERNQANFEDFESKIFH
jgi:hypothetical protein